ncbi:snRNA-activating protein complex subunit 3 [Chionoecetes opilio]|uniref:snRNA-activating protein complex subunit 3 n=1 Tax=Chionoecetes opilio TaxID=41210 RepID=A0A8J5CDY3_CHIOP|nr:snRNA-activating protein complex subunit 3 [Chionoecetes opilio]
MEDIFSVKNVPWVSEEPINLKEYFESYSEVTSPLPEDALDVKEAIRKCFPAPPPDGKEDPFNILKLEAACDPDMLTVKNELMPQDVSQFPAKQTGRISNWYAGTFKDTVIPEGGAETLHTLADQAKENRMRETVADYANLRHRSLKYSNVVRLVRDEKDIYESEASEKYPPPETLDDILINVRVHRPFHRKIYLSKVSNTFPKCCQELLFLGSQKLTDLRDNINCINDFAVCKDLSATPKLVCIPRLPNAAKVFPSGFMYINGVFYNDMRSPEAKDNSEGIKKWAEKRKEIGPMVTKKMEDTDLRDLELRLGYPYVFVHLGNCEHILVFTDARLHHREDVQDPSLYPISWGQPVKLAARCYICSLNLANWITKGDPRLPLEYSLLCDRCLTTLCYDSLGKKAHTLKVYPFVDELMQKQNKFFLE